MNPWDILGVPVEATREEIRRAWRRKAFQLHPDRGGDAELFKEALYAYEVLSGRWQAGFVGAAGDTGQGGGPVFQQFAQAYFDAWHSVPDHIRFRFSLFKLLHTASLAVAFPLFFGGGLLLFAGLLFGNPPKGMVLREAICFAVAAVPVLGVYTRFWDRLRVDLQDKYSRWRAYETMGTSRARAAITAGGIQASARWTKTTPSAAPDRRGAAAGCAVLLAALLVVSIYLSLTAPKQKVDPAVAMLFNGALYGIPLAFLLRYVFKSR